MRVIKIILIYSAVLVLGYLGTGLLFFYLKPEVKLLPKFVENILKDEKVWEVKDPDIQNLEGFEYEILHPENLLPERPILFTANYGSTHDILCFRGSPQRNNPVRGTIDFVPTRIELDWIFETAYDGRTTPYGTWGGGSGWTGQPLIVHWSDEQWQKMNSQSEKPNAEVILGSLSGNIYFLNFSTGEATRPHLTIQNPIKGTVSVDPRLNGLLFVGQGIPNGDRFGGYVFDMFQQKEILYRSGMDAEAHRLWGAFDSNALIDPKSGCWIQPAENGMVYKAWIRPNGTISKSAKFRYKTTTTKELGIESSFGAWNNLGWFGDNSGNVFCLNLMTMEPIWWFNNTDDTDASMVVDLYDQLHPKLFVANEVDKQGANGQASIRMLDGLTGEQEWKVSRSCTGTSLGGKVNSGGVLSTILLGKEKAKDLVYGIFSRTNGSLRGELVAINKQTGKEVFQVPLDNFSWASPIAIYDKSGNPYVFCTDVYGNIYLINGLSGAIIFKEKMDCVWESSPVAVGNRIVLGSRGNRIYSFLLK